MIAATLLQNMADVGTAVWRASWQASVLAVLVFAIQLAFGRRIPARWRHTMWMLVLVRLAMPVVPSSPLSVFNLTPSRAMAVETTAAQTLYTAIDPAPAVTVRNASVRTNAGLFQDDPGGAPGVTTVVDAAAIAPTEPLPIGYAQTATSLWTQWPQILAACWAAGACLLALRIAWGTLRVSRMMRKLDCVEDPAVRQILRDAAVELRVRRLPTLLTGDGFFNPALVGFIRPRLLLPADLLHRFEPAELRLVLLHELAHLKRRDVVINWLATFLTVLHWPNPIAWLACWRLRLERELACDELVMSRTTSEADRRAYGHTIVKLLETFSHRGAAAAGSMPGAVGILEGKEQMKRRITMIAHFGTRARRWTFVAALLVLGLGLVTLTDAVGNAAPEKPEPSAAPVGRVAAGTLGEERAIAPITRPLTIDADELVTFSIMDLVGPGIETVKTSRVDTEGNINLPYVGLVKAKGLRPLELEQALAKAFKDKKLVNNPLVVVSLPGRGESHALNNRTAHAQNVVPAAGDGGKVPAIEAAFEKIVPEVSFDGAPLRDVVDFLRDSSGVNIVVDWRALEAAGIDRTAPVTAQLKNVAFKNVLAIILHNISINAPIDYTVANGVIQIGQFGGQSGELEVKAYDVRDLLGVSANPDDARKKMAEIINVVCENVQPGQWDGGSGSSRPTALGAKLVVTATKTVHGKVDNLLKVIRETPISKSAATDEESPLLKQVNELWETKYKPLVKSIDGKTNELELRKQFVEEANRLYGEKADVNSPILRPRPAGVPGTE